MNSDKPLLKPSFINNIESSIEQNRYDDYAKRVTFSLQLIRRGEPQHAWYNCSFEDPTCAGRKG